MFPIERQNKIIDYISEFGRMTIETLSEKLKVTPTTIRRDLKILEEKEKITRTFGGAVLKEELVEEINTAQKSATFIKEKKEIASFALSMIKAGNIIILDAGTTNMEIARALIASEIKATIITNDVLIAAALLNAPKLTVHCVGGVVQRSIGACLGDRAKSYFEAINADILFMGVSSIDLETGICTPTIEKAVLKKAMMTVSQKLVVVSDHSKFGKKSFARIASIDEFDWLITDTALDPSTKEKLKNKKINVKYVGD